MPGHEQTKRALSRFEEVRDIIREAKVELRGATYYPPPETRNYLSEAVSNLAAAERALRTVLGLLGDAGRETTAEAGPQEPARTWFCALRPVNLEQGNEPS